MNRRMRFRDRLFLAFLSAVAVLAGSHPRAEASCGSATCPIDPQSLNLPSPGQWTFDLSEQYIDQDRLRHGQRDVSRPEPPEEGELELRTVNRITTFFANYAPTSDLLVSAALPYVSRYHEHFDSREFQRYHLDGIGDASVSARYRLLPSLWGGLAVKLPTGNRSSSNAEGQEAEPTIAPGSGSTDVSASIVFQTTANVPSLTHGPLGNNAALPLFLGVTGRRNGRGTKDYRAGSEIQVNAGANYPVSGTFQALFQLNYRAKTKDDVGKTDAVRDDTGGTFLYASPGARVVFSPLAAIYGYVQLPLYQRINGVNIVSRYNFLGGVQVRI
jgi:hypothetical protein